MPKLRYNGSKSNASANKLHEPVRELRLGQFGVYPIPPEHLWSLLHSKSSVLGVKNFDVTTEQDVQTLSSIFMREQILCAELEDRVQLTVELAVGSNKADVWVLLFNGMPIASVEIKKRDINSPEVPAPEETMRECKASPEESSHRFSETGRVAQNGEPAVKEGEADGAPKQPNQDTTRPSAEKFFSEHAYGQIADYMETVRSFHGLHHVFGVLTDFESWQILWFPETEKVAAATTRETHSDPVTHTFPQDRAVCASKLYKSSSPADLKELCLVITTLYKKGFDHRMQRDLRALELVSEHRAYLKIAKDKWFWQTLVSAEMATIRKSGLTLESPASNTLEFYLLRDLGHGADGSAWLTTSSSGRLAVVKTVTDESAASAECARWRRTWKQLLKRCELFSRSKFCAMLWPGWPRRA